jgi:hypothetical protein
MQQRHSTSKAVDPLEHFIETPWWQGRNRSATIDLEYYGCRNMKGSGEETGFNETNGNRGNGFWPTIP